MPAAQQVYYPAFDREFLPCRRTSSLAFSIGSTNWDCGWKHSPHYRMTGREDYRLRIGDYRVIYHFDLPNNILYLWNLGHRRAVYRSR